ncbi:MAG: tRNA (N6-threonylcarbamoyladenosine(37)-N6)-methyltransferase TrmO [Rhodobiaceae bacterium]|nr:tRNA (N6-threonylcarbamoyladenosine(37)-N6)-methyltransferase TrmO [Rhodobiaceae bacterium]
MSETGDLRPGEESVSVDMPYDAEIRFIGVIHTPWTDRPDCPRQGSHDGPDCRVEIFAPWTDALAGIERFETLEILYWLNQARRDLVLQKPSFRDYAAGTFALRSPNRPNPIGLSQVKLVSVEPNAVIVRGLDCLDGTPLVDVKPDRCVFCKAHDV